MSLTLSFESLSLEGDELEVGDVEGHFDNTLKNPLTQEDYLDCVNVVETWKGVNERGYITRQDVTRLYEMKEKFPHLETFFVRHPLGSFTTEPSHVNYEESNEGFLSTIATALIKAIRATIDWIIEKAQALWNWFTGTTVRSNKVEEVAKNLLALQGYLQEVIPLLEKGNQAEKFKLHYKRALDTQLHNVNKTWNALADKINKSEGEYAGQIQDICLVLSSQVPGFIDDVQTLLDMLSVAETESQVEQAVQANTIARGKVSTNSVAQLALKFGYNPNTIKRQQGVTDWQAKCQVVLGHYRGLSNDKRVDIPEANFRGVLLNTRISNWSDYMKDTERALGSKIPDMIKKLRGFDPSKMNPNLDAAYRRHLINYLPALVSTLQGFSHLQEAVGLVANVRDASTVAVAKAALALVQSADKFVTENFDSLTLSEQAIRKKHKSAVHASFT